jgi:zinc transport system substrate-binding protein
MPALLAILALLVGCGPAEPTGTQLAPPTPEVLCANHASYALLQALAPPEIPIECVLNGVAASEFKPDRQQLKRLQQAALVVLNGANLEGWSGRSNLPASRVVDSSKAIAEKLIQIKGKAHSHGAGGNHSHSEVNPYLWLDPVLLSAQAEAVGAALRTAFPLHADVVSQNEKQLLEELAQLNLSWQAFSARAQETTLSGEHKALEYLARRYNLVFTGASQLELDLLLQPNSNSTLIDRLQHNLSLLNAVIPN